MRLSLAVQGLSFRVFRVFRDFRVFSDLRDFRDLKDPNDFKAFGALKPGTVLNARGGAFIMKRAGRDYCRLTIRGCTRAGRMPVRCMIF